MTDVPNVPPPPTPPQQRSWLKWLLIGGGGCLVLLFLLFGLVACLAIIGASGGGGGGQSPAPVDQEGGQGRQSGDEAESREANEGGQETAIIRVGGTPGMRFTGDIGNMDTTRTVDGVTPAEFEVDFSSDAFDMDSIYVSFFKEMNAQAEYPDGTLEVQIVVDGEVVQESSSSADDGYVSITWSPE